MRRYTLDMREICGRHGGWRIFRSADKRWKGEVYRNNLKSDRERGERGGREISWKETRREYEVPRDKETKDRGMPSGE